MLIEKMKVLGLVLILAFSMASAGSSKNSQDVKNAVKKFFDKREYAAANPRQAVSSQKHGPGGHPDRRGIARQAP